MGRRPDDPLGRWVLEQLAARGFRVSVSTIATSASPPFDRRQRLDAARAVEAAVPEDPVAATYKLIDMAKDTSA